jgi:redox-sensitive bicupin YhaK (pirin superfamily)
MVTRNEGLIEVKKATDRFETSIDWLKSNHSFSFGEHYDADNTHHGLLLVSNDDIIDANTGFQTHPHRDMEIVTWVLDGELEHKDSQGNKGIIYPGLAQRMSAGHGIWHSEINPSKTKAVRLVQMWVHPDARGVNPGYEQLDISSELAKGGLVPIASGQGHNAAISIRQKDAVLWGGRLKPGETVKIPDVRFAHVYIAKGSGTLSGAGVLAEGDAARLTAAGSPSFSADTKTGAEILVWAMAS